MSLTTDIYNVVCVQFCPKLQQNIGNKRRMQGNGKSLTRWNSFEPSSIVSIGVDTLMGKELLEKSSFPGEYKEQNMMHIIQDER